ncbi:L-cysteine:1D-myo-inositol 2-amino-2-deoxy-alpha-D-glucopyranoside ligase [Actinokineospora alba]|uniref:L-cysteine:1D-myo-inositol 2-amino-2-deoxy-alpha-D-glucopyranoside ligase n=1 Tax=Actinokineospora alba TaxID=504798 RepID=A0A1H0GKB8_9PSEU|nr:cysteine--1-D-myo-inosityl 2-amino-2-deoxy-alpha-D-glucopyranoside ligase [Actinokineospora alba]TDP69930.1 L-cysteine:1D-myo-inositol 2-amino-2-deoxy-alpha-D-glucopyranoside ligase [Actinokineospora alba]SDI05696.1 L-cysteine:1D-myo-inositol 2-amino-2-deoxy-alpha-D-glucopyranoside ligase [Actinokineospora alba]SDO07280.1 L-cysteine:1D-myo-inositol 2-amino-2-deoxy-alpha-D-glucopyranoside ligase [Actinokineospora alba]
MQTWQSHPVPRVPGTPRPLRLHDTSAGEIRLTTPGPTATMYVCGITPYDATHLGHAATYLAFDLVHRVWLDNGHQVHYVQNVTDIDDPLLERAERDQDDWVVLGMRETALFREDMTALRVLPPREYIGAVEAIPEVVEAVAKLLANGAAYHADDPEFPDIYFDHQASGQFGAESRYDEQTMAKYFAERGGDPDRKGKRHPLDALLWRVARPGEPSWDSELGPGRPGWHIECSAIALNRLGMGFDLQGGGSDLIFPHHEFSAAHAEALTGRNPFAQHYAHAAMIGLDGEKMSKSRGNLVFVSRLRADNVDIMAVRLGLLSGHYREDRTWTQNVLDEAVTRMARWREAVNAAKGVDAAPLIAEIREHLSNDLDTPAAIAAIDAWAEQTRLGEGTEDNAPAEAKAAIDALLGIEL